MPEYESKYWHTKWIMSDLKARDFLGLKTMLDENTKMDVNHRDADGNTPLHKAMYFVTMMDILVQHGADVNLVND